jgi:glycosyltransferase involved in cell wall biosynthesis
LKAGAGSQIGGSTFTVGIDARHLRDFGIGTYIRNLLPEIGAADPRIEYRVVYTPGDKELLASLPSNFQLFPYPRQDRERLDHIRFPWFMRGLEVDLTHIPLNRVALFMPRPYVVTVHDISNLLFEPGEGLMPHLRRARFKRGLARAERVIAVSSATRRDVVQTLSIPEERVHLIYNALDPKFLQPRPMINARAAGPDSETFERRRILERYQIHYPYLLYVGQIRPQKNIPRLVEAFAVVRNQLKDHPDFRDLRLIVIGDQISKYPAVRRAVIESRVEEAVRFLGFVPFDTLRIFYEKAEAFIFPSLYEGFGLAPLEAMACGAPVVTSAASSLPEVVADAAVLVNPENVFDIARGILDALLDNALRSRLIAKGRERARYFSWREAGRRVVQVYRLAAGQGEDSADGPG